MKRTITLTLLILFSNLLAAEDSPARLIFEGKKTLLVGLDSFAIRVSDQVTGGCLPNPTKLKDKMEISLRKNGFGIEKEVGYFTNDIIITALGFAATDTSCAVFISAELLIQTVVDVPFASKVPSGNQTIAPFIYKIGSGILTGKKYTMQNRLEKSVVEYADELYLEISRSRDEIFAEYPSIKSEIIEQSKKNK